MSDLLQQAIAVAIDVSNRRAAGESVLDEEVIRQHQSLSPYLEKELEKLKMLDAARRQVAGDQVPNNQPDDKNGSLDAQTTRADDDQFHSQDEERPFDPRLTAIVSSEDEVYQTQAFSAPSLDGAVPLVQSEAELVAAEKKHTRPFRPIHRPAMAHLGIYHDDMRSVETVALRKDRTIIGRVAGDIIVSHDSLMSSRHAEIVRKQENERWNWYLKDLNSTNGTFVRIEGAVLKDGDELVLGSQHYRFSLVAGEARIEHLIAGQAEDSFPISIEGTAIGRDKADEMPALNDEFLDPAHAFFGLNRAQRWTVKNLQSVNGIWYRVDEVRLVRSCGFQLGEQRFVFRG